MKKDRSQIVAPSMNNKPRSVLSLLPVFVSCAVFLVCSGFAAYLTRRESLDGSEVVLLYGFVCTVTLLSWGVFKIADRFSSGRKES